MAIGTVSWTLKLRTTALTAIFAIAIVADPVGPGASAYGSTSQTASRALTLSVTSSVMSEGQIAHFQVRSASESRGRTARLQSKSGSKWLTIDSTTVSRKRSASFLRALPIGRHKMRVVLMKTRRHKSITSNAIIVRVNERPAEPVRRALLPGEQMTAGQSIRSPRGQYQLTMQADGNLVLYDTGDSNALWSTGSLGANRAVMQADGNFVVYSAGNAVWTSGTDGFLNGRLVLQDDGNLVVYDDDQAVWSRHDGYLGDQLRNGISLAEGRRLLSSDHRFSLEVQGDGNVVVYDQQSGEAAWAASTQGAGNRLVMQPDGNLVIYNSADQALWSAGSAGFGPSATLVMQNDGNLVVYAHGLPVWSRGTGYIGGRLSPDQTMDAGDLRRSQNGRYRLYMQGDGNLVMYDTSNGAALWSSGTSGNNHAVMQGDGNLVVYPAAGAALWSSGTGGRNGARLEVQDDGNLVLYQGGTAIWSRNSGPVSGIDAQTDAFVGRWNGRYVDVDGVPAGQPYQCTDLFNKFHTEVMGGTYVRMGGDGGAKNLWNTTNDQMLSKYTKISPSQAARKGDVAVWSGESLGSGGYGHVAIVLNDSGSNLSIFTQNPGAAQVASHSKAHLLGYFRPNT